MKLATTTCAMTLSAVPSLHCGPCQQESAASFASTWARDAPIDTLPEDFTHQQRPRSDAEVTRPQALELPHLVGLGIPALGIRRSR